MGRSEQEALLTFSVQLPADVVDLLGDLQARIPESRRAAADRRLRREVLLAILRFHSDEGRQNLGMRPAPMLQAVD